MFCQALQAILMHVCSPVWVSPSGRHKGWLLVQVLDRKNPTGSAGVRRLALGHSGAGRIVEHRQETGCPGPSPPISGGVSRGPVS